MAVGRAVMGIWLGVVLGNTCLADEYAGLEPTVQLPTNLPEPVLVSGMAMPDPYLASSAPPQPTDGVLPSPSVSLPAPITVAPVVENGTECLNGSAAVAACCDPCGWQYRTSAWRIEAGLLPMQSRMTRGQFGDWLLGESEMGTAGRLTVGYEHVSGVGLRVRIWGFDQTVTTSTSEVDIDLGSFHLDFYKRLFIESAEVVIGAGSADGRLAFILPDNTQSKFTGSGGISVFVEGWQPLLRFTRADLGLAGRGRYSLVTGRWKDDTGSVVGPTFHDTLSIADIAFGLEFRRRFGCNQDNYWYFQWLTEYQRWDSSWLTVNTGSSVGLTGVNLNLGVVF